MTLMLAVALSLAGLQKPSNATVHSVVVIGYSSLLNHTALDLLVSHAYLFAPSTSCRTQYLLDGAIVPQWEECHPFTNSFP